MTLFLVSIITNTKSSDNFSNPIETIARGLKEAGYVLDKKTFFQHYKPFIILGGALLGTACIVSGTYYGVKRFTNFSTPRDFSNTINNITTFQNIFCQKVSKELTDLKSNLVALLKTTNANNTQAAAIATNFSLHEQQMQGIAHSQKEHAQTASSSFQDSSETLEIIKSAFNDKSKQSLLTMQSLQKPESHSHKIMTELNNQHKGQLDQVQTHQKKLDAMSTIQKQTSEGLLLQGRNLETLHEGFQGLSINLRTLIKNLEPNL